MQVNLTADHRVVYGADGALFLKELSYLIEETDWKYSVIYINIALYFMSIFN